MIMVFRNLSRKENQELFSLVIGGYGLFGVIATIDLRLGRRTKLERVVEVITLAELPAMAKKRIKDGWEYKRDRNGTIINNEDGNPIKIDKYKTVTAILLETIQIKSVFVGGDVQYLNLQKGREINHHPLASEFVFENIFASYRGDERALTNEDKILVNNRFVPFPNNSRMLLDAGEDVKIQLKEILKENSFR